MASSSCTKGLKHLRRSAPICPASLTWSGISASAGPRPTGPMAATGSRRGEALTAQAQVGLRVYRTCLPRDAVRPDGRPTLSPEQDALADQLRRLLPSHRDPKRIHVERDAIEGPYAVWRVERLRANCQNGNAA